MQMGAPDDTERFRVLGDSHFAVPGLRAVGVLDTCSPSGRPKLAVGHRLTWSRAAKLGGPLMILLVKLPKD